MVNGKRSSDSLDGTLAEAGITDMNIEYEYVSLEEKESILAPGRVSCFTFNYSLHLQHVAEFKHVFDFFTTPTAADKAKKAEEDKKNLKDDSKDVF